MRIYHFTNMDGISAYFTDKEQARRCYRRRLKVDDPGEWEETEPVALLKEKDYEIARQQYIINRLCDALDSLGDYDPWSLPREFGQRYDEIMAVK